MYFMHSLRQTQHNKALLLIYILEFAHNLERLNKVIILADSHPPWPSSYRTCYWTQVREFKRGRRR
jgi:hypothetical protein